MSRLLTLVAALAAVVLGLAACDGENAGPADSGATVAEGQLAAGVGDAPPVPEGITVTGTGRVAGVPDTLLASVGVEVRAETVGEAFTQASERAESVVAALEDAGVAEDDLRTRDLSVRAEHEHDPERNGRQLVGYVVSNIVEATIRDVDAAGEILDAAVQAGGDAARIGHVRFELEDNAAQLASARERAFDDAQAKADTYAEQAGLELGRLVNLREVRASQPALQRGGPETGGAAASAPAPPPVRPGEEETTVILEATWAIE